MNWHYVQAGNSVGPVSQEEFDRLAQSGIIQADTLVWHEGLANWQPYSAVRPSAPPAGVAAPSATLTAATQQAVAAGTDVVCAECNGVFPKENAIQYGAVWVCANCKPVFLQKLREGAAPTDVRYRSNLPTDPDELARTIQARDYSLSIGDCVTRAWELVKNNFWLLVGGTFISMAVQQAMGLIPILGIVLPLIVYGIFYGGLYVLFLKAIRGENATISDIFSGFSSRALHLTLTTIVQALIVIAIFAVGGVLGALLVPVMKNNNMNPLVLLALTPIVVIPTTYLMVSWSLSLILVADRGLSFWSAMEVSRKVVTMHWWKFFGLLLMGALLMIVGVLACLIGAIVAMPIFFAMLAYAYEDIFGSGRALKA